MKVLFSLLLVLLSTILASGQLGMEQIIEPFDPKIITSGDLDADGDKDLLVGSPSTNKLIWYQNDGLANFSEITIDDFVTGADFAQIADIDGDGDLDIVAYTLLNQSVVYYENLDGQANFDDQKLIVSNVQNISENILFDIDLDNDIDIILAYDGHLAWLENLDGAGDFGDLIFIEDGLDGDLHLNIADLNNDTYPDIIIGSKSEELLKWVEHEDGNGNFSVPFNLAQNNSGFSATNIGDLDNDGDLDVIGITNGSNNNFVWYENQNGSGFFQTGGQYLDDFSDTAKQLSLIDSDNDGDLDIVALFSTQLNTTIRLLINQGTGVFFKEPGAASLENINAYMLLDDLNGDAVIDFVTVSNDDAESVIELFEFSTSANPVTWSHFIEEPSISGFGYTEDVDLDGDQDLVGLKNNQIILYENINGQGVFSHRQLLHSFSFVLNSIEFEEINNDGFIDMVALDIGDELAWFPRNAGLLEFSNKIVVSNDSDVLEAIAIGDLDNDGDQDIVAGASDLVWFENLDGLGQFGPANFLFSFDDPAIPGLVRHIEIADNNGDGQMDILVGSTSRIGWLTNNGQGNFSNFSNFTSSFQGSDDLLPIDIDGDQDIDVAYVSHNLDKIAWYENTDGQGNFDFGANIDTEIGIIAEIDAIDIDLDGDLDLIAGDWWNDQFMWYENTDGLGNFGAKNLIAENVTNISSVGTADFNEDNVLDIFYNSTTKIAWHQNLAEAPSIQVLTYWDENENLIKDANEIGLNQQEITLNPNELNIYPITNGLIEFPTNFGEHEIICTPAEGWELTTASVINFEINENDPSPFTIQFGLAQNGETNLANVDLSSAATRCGFTVPFWLTYHNAGNQISDTEITLELDNLSLFESADPVPSQINGNTLTWFFNDLNPTYSGNIYLELTMPGVDYLGDLLNFTSSIRLRDNNGTTTAESEHIYSPQINCAYDPNDKLIDPDYPGETNYTIHDTKLEYTVRFQNTGTDTAFTVVLEDQLDENLDWSTFEPLASSHPYRVKLSNNGLATFIFEDILLPDSITNFIASNGFVKYKILPIENLPDLTIIENSAAIFFDFNPEILTNTTINVMVSEIPTSVNDVFETPTFTLFPNPTSSKSILQIESNNNHPLEVKIFNNTGQQIRSIVQDVNFTGTQQFEIDNLPSGIYIISLFSKDYVSSNKLVIID